MFSRHIHGTLHPRNAAWQAEEDQCEAVASVGWEIQEREGRDREVLQADLKAAQSTAVRIPDRAGSLSIWAACTQVTTWLSGRTVSVEFFYS